MIHCLSCSYPFKATARRKMFCSRDCRRDWEHWDAKRRGGHHTLCPECGNEFYRKPRRIKHGKALYCSRICALKSTPRTWIEEALCDALTELDLVYIEQEELLDNWIVDVYIPKYHLAIEAQGSYWHAKAGTIASDSKKRQAFMEHKINLLEIAEDEFNDPDWVIGKIRNTIALLSQV